MNLQTKISYRFLALLLIVFMAAGGILYVVLGMVVNNNLDDVLKEKRDKINGSLTTIQSVAQIADSPDKTVTIRLVFRAHLPNTYSDTVTFDTDANENISYRRLTFDKLVQGERYEISICLSKLETEDLVQLIFYFMVGLLAVIVAILFFLNRWLTAGAWSPFYKTLEQLNAIKIGQEENIAFGNSPVDEFAELNRSLAAMVQKAQSDFRNLKEFTENASHEIQTPIAIIKSKLESVLQDKALSPQRYRQIQSAYESASRLAKLNEALLLLSKIENRQFGDEIEIDLCKIIVERLEFIEELITFKKIEIRLNMHQPIAIRINPYLAEILVNNLLGNAIKHNVEGGTIELSTTTNSITFSNTGTPLSIAPEKLFLRFMKHNAGSESTGLGLAIASEICKNNNLSIQYSYQNGLHNITLSVGTAMKI